MPHRRDQRHDDMRQAIMLAAVRVVAEHGIAGATTRRIAEVAGVPLGSVHYWYASKAVLLEAVAHYLLARVAVQIAQPGEEATLADQLMWLYDRSGEFDLNEQLAFFEIMMHSLREERSAAASENQASVSDFGAQLLAPWRAGADATLPGGFDALNALVKSVTIGTWFEGLSQDREEVARGVRLLAELLRHVPRDANPEAACPPE
jgi:TetR/AcrR family transcriptional regulator, regulator of biofilm formation and stress response